MTTMLEKMAQAMVAAAFSDFDRNTGGVKLSDDGLSAEAYDGTALDFSKIARAGLLAIRLPDAAMIAASNDWWGEDESTAPPHDFTAMIDAILNEKPEDTT